MKEKEPIFKVRSELNYLNRLNFDMYRKDFLLTWEKTHAELIATLSMAQIMQLLYRDNVAMRAFQTGLAISQFRDKSTRTRFAFSSACNMLGLGVEDVDDEKTQVAHGETVRETANMISFLSEVIGIRDDMYIGRGHTFMKEVAGALDEGFNERVLNMRPAVINLQSDLDHPTQTMSDLLHLQNYFGGIKNLKGKKIVMSWAYSPSYGKPLSVPQGIIALMTRFGMDVTLAHPEGYELMDDIVNLSAKQAKQSGGSFKVSHDMKAAFKGADIVYPKSWASFSVMKERTKLLEKNDSAGLKDLEKKCLTENAKHKDWLCDEKIMSTTKNGEALYLHCLPADVQGLNCKAGEVTHGVFEKYRIETYREARYKPFVIAAMIMLCCFRDPVAVMEGFYRNSKNRAG
ncbi:knotted carbamoyltransferase YgeW [bacterium]|nr:knotted carbamoyltransferase YgeW [Candidatus Omnitrophota bacterium]MBU2528531.1 knotted carbamoyltransferase YgeW [bacterium]MBU3929875.1 knotted carbamoyltransferase YgeW [bacterium]MBU4122220.1 knotted carbamoyltransferase YgeW [bacterium]